MAVVATSSVLCRALIVVRSNAREQLGPIDRPDVADATLVAQGKRLYATPYAGCHGAELEGQPGWPRRPPNGTMPASPLDASGRTRQRDDRWIFTTIKHGGQATAAPGSASGVSDAEIWAIV